jgi:cation diffusion facilitator CzcD-associated flavoprotein CzcO
MTSTDVALIGAGPYGLAAAAHLRRAGVDTDPRGADVVLAGSARRESYQETAV